MDDMLLLKVYDAINDHEELPNIHFPDPDEDKAIIEFHACEWFAN